MRFLPTIILILAFVGLADASYLAWATYTGSSLSCGILDGCNTVAQSEYSRLLGVPLSYLGFLYYMGATILALGYIMRPAIRTLRFLLAAGFAGALFSVYFMYLQVFLIKAVCLYCLISATVAGLLLCTTLFLTIHRRKKNL